MNRQSRPDRCRHRLINQPDTTRACTQYRFTNSTSFNFRRLARDADQDHGAGSDKTIFMHLSNEVLEHLLRHLEICDDTVFQGTNCRDVSGCPTQHPFSVQAYGGDAFLIVLVPYRNH